MNDECIQADRVRDMELDNAILKTNYATMTTSINRIENKLDRFIDAADKRYVTKEELGFKLQPIEQKISVNATAVGKVADWIAKYGPVVVILSYVVLQGNIL